ncbi:DoxX family protein [Flavobacterium sp. DG1-102-2]|uniref:DoxX family protein n=1 Tax=Flavobacterium sp. DG1-102-2 TaxID=3081663 RepID=UPI002948F748|nr:DoxX family protein [Flavobacterium sp. DG1-102-2]MDV6169810.1 DoxX family protein [Flavobacterium sp. DG1-102-2]
MWLFNTSRDKKLYHTGLFLLRVVVSCFMLTHGAKKYMMLFSTEPVTFTDPLGIGSDASLILAFVAEFICSILILIGFTTRLVVLPLIVNMFVVIFVVHASDGFEKQELPGLYLVIYVLLFITGSGKYSIDHLIYKKNRPRTYS